MSTDGDGMEFREAAEKLYLSEFGLINTDDLMIESLARAMRIAAEATRDHMMADPDVEPCDDFGDARLGSKCFSAVASRIGARIDKK